jgi:hypothetical protein
LLALILVLSFYLRWPILGQPYWGDEILSLQIAKHFQDDISGLFQYLQAVEVHPPLYYLNLYQEIHQHQVIVIVLQI